MTEKREPTRSGSDRLPLKRRRPEGAPWCGTGLRWLNWLLLAVATVGCAHTDLPDAHTDLPDAHTDLPDAHTDLPDLTSPPRATKPVPPEQTEAVTVEPTAPRRPAVTPVAYQPEPAKGPVDDSSTPQPAAQADPPVRTAPGMSVNAAAAHGGADVPRRWTAATLPELALQTPPIEGEGRPGGDGNPESAGLEPLTLDDVAAVAFDNHPAVAASRASLSAARGQWVQAGLPPNPTLQYISDEVGAGGVSGLHSVTIGQTIVTADKLDLQQRVLAARIRAARAELEASRQRVRTDVAAAFFRSLIAQRRVELLERLRGIAEQSVRSVETLFKAAEETRIALLQAQNEAAQARLAVETATATLAGARRELAAVAATESLDDQPLAGDVTGLLEAMSWESMRENLLATSPELAGRIAEIDRARRQLSLARAQVTPNVNARVGVGYDAGSNDTFGAVQVTVPLPIRNRNQGNIRRARADIAAASHRLRQKEYDLAERLAGDFQTYETARLRRERILETIVPRAEETLELTRQAFRAGETSYLQLLTAQRALFESRLDALNATDTALQSATRLRGTLLSGSLRDR